MSGEQLIHSAHAESEPPDVAHRAFANTCAVRGDDDNRLGHRQCEGARRRAQSRAPDRHNSRARKTRTCSWSAPTTSGITALCTDSAGASSPTWSPVSRRGSPRSSRSSASATGRLLRGRNASSSRSVLAPGSGEHADGVSFEVPVPTRIIVKGIDKEKVGQVAADIRKLRKPEPYKGKGVRYAGERVLRKAGKAAK